HSVAMSPKAGAHGELCGILCSKAALDQFIGALRSIALRAKNGDPALKTAPHFAPRARLDETLAARRPVLAWEG
ncbi:MAG: hypothetical protein ACT6RM_09705, partial [Sphingopyxis sp.]